MRITLTGGALKVEVERDGDVITVFAMSTVHPDAWDVCFSDTTVVVGDLEVGRIYTVRSPVHYPLSTNGVKVDLLREALGQLGKEGADIRSRYEAALNVIYADPLNHTGAFSRVLAVKDANLRRAMVQKLYAKEKAFPLIGRLVSDPDRAIARYAVRSVAMFAGAKANGELAALMRTGQPAVRTLAAAELLLRLERNTNSTAALRSLAKPFVPAIAALLEDDEGVDLGLVKALEACALPALGPHMERLLAHRDRAIRTRTAYVLLQMLSPAGVPTLIEDVRHTIEAAEDRWQVPEYVRTLDRLSQGFELWLGQARELPKSVAREEVLVPLEDWWRRNADGFHPGKALLRNLESGVPRSLWKERAVWKLYFIPADVRKRILAVETLVPYPEARYSSCEPPRALAQEWPRYGPSALIRALGRTASPWDVEKIVATLERVVPDPPATAVPLRQLMKNAPEADQEKEVSRLRLAWQEWWGRKRQSYPDVVALLRDDESRWLEAACEAVKLMERAVQAEKSFRFDEALDLYREAWRLDQHRGELVTRYVSCIIRSRPADLAESLDAWLGHESADVRAAAVEGAYYAPVLEKGVEWDRAVYMEVYDLRTRAIELFLDDPSPLVRRIAAGHVSGKKMWLKGLADPDPVVSWNAAADLARSAEQNPDLAARALRDDRWQIRRIVLNMLSAKNVSEGPVLSAVIACSQDDNFLVREEAIRDLACIRSPKSVEALIAALEDERNGVYLVNRALKRATGKRFDGERRAELARKWREWMKAGAAPDKGAKKRALPGSEW